MNLPFTKMHGCGNDYVVLDGFRDTVADPEALARVMAPRRFGAGSDGLILALPSETADVQMRMFNVDGTEAEMCGNGLRCMVKLVCERGYMAGRRSGTADTGAGILGWRVAPDADGTISEVTIDMGTPRLQRADIPMVGPDGPVRDEALEVGGRSFDVTAVSMGNPHAVSWVESVASFPLETYGPLVENHASFPRRTNAEFVEIVSPGEVHQRTWERGCGETYACGTGACAVVVAGVETGRTAREVLVHLVGGDLRITYGEDGHVHMAGPAVAVYEGVWTVK